MVKELARHPRARIVLLVLCSQWFIPSVQGGDEGDIPTAEVLRQADQKLNQLYQEKLAGLGNADRRDLRQSQGIWIESRDRGCQVDSDITKRDDWIDVAAADPSKAKCLIRATNSRIQWLAKINLTEIPSSVAELKICHFLTDTILESDLSRYLNYYSPQRQAGFFDSSVDQGEGNTITYKSIAGNDATLVFASATDKQRLQSGLRYTLIEQELDGDGIKDMIFLYRSGERSVATNHGRFMVVDSTAPKRRVYYRKGKKGYHFIGEEYRQFPFIDHRTSEGNAPGKCSPWITFAQRDGERYKVSLFGKCDAVEVPMMAPRGSGMPLAMRRASPAMTTGIAYAFTRPNRLVVSNYRRNAFRSVCGVTAAPDKPTVTLDCPDTDLCLKAKSAGQGFPSSYLPRFSIDQRHRRDAFTELDPRDRSAIPNCDAGAFRLDINNDNETETVCQSRREPGRLYFYREQHGTFEPLEARPLLGELAPVNCDRNACILEHGRSIKIMRYNDVNYIIDYRKALPKQINYEFAGQETAKLWRVVNGDTKYMGRIIYRDSFDLNVHTQ
jgi:uncharacterized protein YecT (DUF1311 family)